MCSFDIVANNVVCNEMADWKDGVGQSEGPRLCCSSDNDCRLDFGVDFYRAARMNE